MWLPKGLRSLTRPSCLNQRSSNINTILEFHEGCTNSPRPDVEGSRSDLRQRGTRCFLGRDGRGFSHAHRATQGRGGWLKWSNVRPELNCVTERKTKNGKDLRTPLRSQAWSVLQAMRQHQLEGCQLVWHQQNGKSFYHTFKAHWQRVLKLAGLEDKMLWLHDLRHTFGSLLGAASMGGTACGQHESAGHWP